MASTSLVMVIGLLGWLEWSHRAYLADLRSRGEPVSLSDLQQSVAVLSSEVDCTEFWIKAADLEAQARRDVDLGPRGARPRVPFIDDGALLPSPGFPWPAKESATRCADARGELSALCRQAVLRGGRAHFKSDSMDDRDAWSSRLTQLGEGLALAATVHLHRGEYSQAADRIEEISVLLRALEEEISPWAGAVRFKLADIVHKLSATFCSFPVEEEALFARLQQTLESIQCRRALERSLQAQRVRMLTSTGAASWPVIDGIVAWVLSGERKTLERFVSASRQPWNKARTLVDSKDRRSCCWLMPSARAKEAPNRWWSELTQTMRAETRIRLACVGLALSRHRLRSSEIAEAYSTELLRLAKIGWNDPFSGESLRCRAEGDRLVIYSVGPNSTDDGGKMNPISGRDDDVTFWMLSGRG